MTMPPFESLPDRGRLLLVEEPSVLREIGLLLLRRAGYHATVTANIREAVTIAGLHRFDAIVLNTEPAAWDETFPVQLSQVHPGACLVALLPNVEPERTRELHECGVSAVLTRPLSPAHLLEQIDGVLGYNFTPGAPKEYHDSAAAPRTSPTELLLPADPPLGRRVAGPSDPIVAPTGRTSVVQPELARE